MKYIENDSNDPRYNLALEEYCFKYLPKNEDYTILWINSPAIIIGKNQNTVEEVNLGYVKEKGISIVRRITGGGAVYHDLGNLNFSFIVNSKGEKVIDFKKYNIPILKSLKKLGIQCDLSGRNDITIDGKKFSGIAQSIWRGRVLNHGTLLFDTELNVLSKALNVKKEKIQSKGIKSIKSRVTNIKPYLKKEISIEDFKKLLLEYIFEAEGKQPDKYDLTHEQLREIEKLFEEKYSTWEWNFGNSPSFNYKNYKKFSFGLVELRLQIDNGIISQCKIYGDFFGSKNIDILEKQLMGLKYDENTLSSFLATIDLKEYFGHIKLNEFVDLLFK